MDSTHKPYFGSGFFSEEFVAGRPSAGTIYVMVTYIDWRLSGIFKSTDYGETWERHIFLYDLVEGDVDFYTMPHGGNGEIGLAASDDYLFVSLRLSSYAGIWRVAHSDNTDHDKILASNTTRNKTSARISATPDGHVVTGNGPGSTFFDPVMLWSNDNGDSWTELKHLSDSSSLGVRVKWIEMNPSDSDEILVMYNTASFTTLYHTTDASNGLACTWTQIQFGLGDPAGRSYEHFAVRWSPLRISVQMVDDDRVILSDDYASEDVSITALIAAAGDGDTTSNYPRVVHPTLSKMIAVSKGGRIYEINGSHPPTGATEISTVPVGPTVLEAHPQYDFNDSSVLYILIAGAGIYRSTDDGVTWIAKCNLGEDYYGDPCKYLEDKFTDTDGTGLAAHTPDFDRDAGGWTVQAGAIEIQSGKAVETVPGAGSLATIDANADYFGGEGGWFMVADIIPAATFDISLYPRWESADHYYRLHLWETGGHLYAQCWYNTGAGEVNMSGPEDVAIMPTSKFQVISMYWYAYKVYTFSVKFTDGVDYEKLLTSFRYTVYSAEATHGFGFEAADTGTQIDAFYITLPWITFYDNFYPYDTAESIDGKVGGAGYYNTGPLYPGSQNPEMVWNAIAGDLDKISGPDTYGDLSGPGGGQETIFDLTEDFYEDIFISQFTFDPAGTQHCAVIFRKQDDDNFLMAGKESGYFKLWEVVGGVKTELASVAHDMSTANGSVMLLALGSHIVMWGVADDPNERIFDDNEVTFRDKAGIGIYQGPNITTASDAIDSSGFITKLTMPAFAGGIRNRVVIIN